MGFFSSDPKWMATPGSGDLANQYKQWGESQGLGVAGKTAKRGLNALAGGDYDSNATIGAYLAPMRDQFASLQRDSNRAYGMGALGMAGGSQPALMARLKQLNEAKLGEQAGMAYGQAIPGLYNMFSNTFQNAQNSRRQAELEGMQGQGQALGMGMWQQKPSIFDNIMKVGQLGGSIAGMAMGIPGLGGGGRLGGGGTMSGSMRMPGAGTYG